ncbi:MAG: endonuclease III, partial [Bacteroidales bacterium]|nr:endonuclease III [Bacteroidales bacterium]
MNRKDRYFHIIKYFQENMPLAETELHYQNPYQLLVAVILSAQCTDRRVNATVPPLFQRYPDPQSLAQAVPEDVYQLIKYVSYPNSKTSHLIGMAEKLVRD